MRRLQISEPVFLIGIAARMVGMHPQTLRLYERVGLIQPARHGHMRLYSERDIQRLLQIQRLTQDMGVNLAGVELVLSLLEKLEQMEKLHDELEARMAELDAKLISARPLPRGI